MLAFWLETTLAHKSSFLCPGTAMRTLYLYSLDFLQPSGDITGWDDDKDRE